jgi:hypothetical protein
LTFVVFNYDRVLEQYLFHAIQNYFHLDKHEAATLVNAIEIANPGKARLSLAREIRTFNEGTDPASSDINAIRSSIGCASRLVFLGFAFHRMNMELLRSDTDGATQVRCFGTA